MIDHTLIKELLETPAQPPTVEPTSEPSELAKQVQSLVEGLQYLWSASNMPATAKPLLTTVLAVRDGLAELEAQYDSSTEALLRSQDCVLHLRTERTDLEARLAAAERELAEARGRLEKVTGRHKQSGVFDECVYCEENWPCETYRLATDTEGGG